MQWTIGRMALHIFTYSDHWKFQDDGTWQKYTLQSPDDLRDGWKHSLLLSCTHDGRCIYAAQSWTGTDTQIAVRMAGEQKWTPIASPPIQPPLDDGSMCGLIVHDQRLFLTLRTRLTTDSDSVFDLTHVFDTTLNRWSSSPSRLNRSRGQHEHEYTYTLPSMTVCNGVLFTSGMESQFWDPDNDQSAYDDMETCLGYMSAETMDTTSDYEKTLRCLHTIDYLRRFPPGLLPIIAGYVVDHALEWKMVEAKPGTIRWNHMVAPHTQGNRIFLLGGQTWQKPTTVDHSEWAETDTVEIFDLGSRTWSMARWRLPGVCWNGTACFVHAQQKLYVLGGCIRAGKLLPFGRSRERRHAAMLRRHAYIVRDMHSGEWSDGPLLPADMTRGHAHRLLLLCEMDRTY